MQYQLKTLTPIECSQLLRYLQQPQNKNIPPRVYHRNYTMAVVMLDTGCRVGELVQLRQDQLWCYNEPAKALVIEKTQAKNKSERTIPITQRLHDAIERMHRDWWYADLGTDTPYAFYQSNQQSPLTTRQVQRIIKAASENSIGKEIHPHILRHTFGSRMMRITSMRVVQELLGHKSINSTQIYTHPNNEDRQMAIDKLNETE